MLNKAALKAGILALLTDMETRTTDSKEEFATRLSGLIDTYVKTAQVNPGIPVQAGPNTGVTTGPGTLS